MNKLFFVLPYGEFIPKGHKNFFTWAEKSKNA